MYRVEASKDAGWLLTDSDTYLQLHCYKVTKSDSDTVVGYILHSIRHSDSDTVITQSGTSFRIYSGTPLVMLPLCTRKMVLQEGWSLVGGRNQWLQILIYV